MPQAFKIDLHMHTTISDGTDTPADLLDTVEKAGITVFSATDHDAIKGSVMLRDLCRSRKETFIPGVEFSCRDGEGRYHILGYGYDPGAEEINRVVETGHNYRMTKVRKRLDFLKTEFGLRFSEEDINGLLKLDNPGKPHIGNLMVKYGYAKTKEEAIRSYINKVKIRSGYIRPEEAIEGILKSGGVPVLAHPTYGSGDQLILGDEMEERVRRLIGFGLRGLEAFYSGFTPKITGGLLKLADKYDLYVTAGSDYHGTNKLVVPGETGLEETDSIPDKLKSFLKAVGQGDII